MLKILMFIYSFIFCCRSFNNKFSVQLYYKTFRLYSIEFNMIVAVLDLPRLKVQFQESFLSLSISTSFYGSKLILISFKQKTSIAKVVQVYISKLNAECRND